MNAGNAFDLPVPSRLHSLPGRLRTLLLSRRGLIALGVLALALGAAFNWSWLVAVGVAPLLVSVLPCVAMCVLGLCMSRMKGSAPVATTATPASEKNETAGPIKPGDSCCSHAADAPLR